MFCPISVDKVGGGSGVWMCCLEKKIERKNKPESLLGTLGWVYVWSITEMKVCCKMSRSVQATWATQERSTASAAALRKRFNQPCWQQSAKIFLALTLCPWQHQPLAFSFRNLQRRPAQMRTPVCPSVCPCSRVGAAAFTSAFPLPSRRQRKA